MFKGAISVDDRGSVSYVNDFEFKDVKRFYMVQNHAKGFIRAWHGHEKERKYVLVVKGTALIRYVPLDGFNKDVSKVVLSDSNPQILYIPSGYANGFKTLTDDAIVMFFSTSTLEESGGDDYRFPYKQWGGTEGWEVEQR